MGDTSILVDKGLKCRKQIALLFLEAFVIKPKTSQCNDHLRNAFAVDRSRRLESAFRQLLLACGCRPSPNQGGGLALRFLLAALQVQNEIESVIQWTGCLQLVVPDLARATRTVPLVGTEVVAGARVGRRDRTKRAGYLTLILTRAMSTMPDSIGCRSMSSVFRGNSQVRRGIGPMIR